MSLAVSAHRSVREQTAFPRLQDSFLERFTKLVPVEVIALHVLAVTALSPSSWAGWSIIFLAAGVALSPVVLFWDAARAAALVPPLQYVIRTLAFAAWALVLDPRLAPSIHVDRRGGPVTALLLPLIGALLVRRPSPGDPP